jgi:hypothetical protein
MANGHEFNDEIEVAEKNMAQTAKKSAREIAMERRRLSYESGKAGLQKMQRSGMPTVAAAKAVATAASRANTSAAANAMSTRQLSLARRQAMSVGGKAAVVSGDRTRADEMSGTTAAPGATLDAPTAASTASPSASQPADSASEKRECGCGCNADKSKRPAATAPTVPNLNRPVVQARRGKKIENPARAASLARRIAMSCKGKAALSGKGPSAAQTARASNPNISSRELAQTIRQSRSKNGKCKTESKCRPTGRRRPGKDNPTAAEDAPWKVGASETSHGQTVTGTMVGRSVGVTGDEPSTCRAITGTEYMGADIFREFCQSDIVKSPRKVRVTSTGTGNAVSGNELGRSAKVTGDEPGTCKRVTGSQYVGAGQVKEFCGTSAEAGPAKITRTETRKGKTVTGNNVGRSGKVTGDEHGSNRELTGTSVVQTGVMQTGDGRAPAKVGKSATLRGGNVTGTMVGRNQNVTGDEPGSCRNVTGDDYVGQEQYSTFCDTTPKVTDRKVGVSATLNNKSVTGTMTGRDSKVTGAEPGTCKAVTGTPYAGAENYKDFCDTISTGMAQARIQQRRATPGMPMTGLQPGVDGKMTGANKGACEPLTGTPYVGADQFANACPSVPADSSSPDFPQPFPQPIGGVPWEQFSVSAPNHASQTTTEHNSVTGTRYEKGHITGPFGMAGGKVTGTEEARFGNDEDVASASYIAQSVEDRVKSRITGEGQDAGLRITGDDWDRNERVTGTEGLSTTRRNLTRRGGMDAMAMQLVIKRNEELPVPNSKVTGSSGNTEKGSLITYSGGARG